MIPGVGHFWGSVLRFFAAMWIDVWRVWTESFSSIWDTLRGVIRGDFLSWWDDYVESEMKESLRQMGMDPKRADFLKAIVGLPFPIDLLTGSFIYLFFISIYPLRYIKSASMRLEWENNESVRPTILDPMTLARYIVQNPDEWETTRKYLSYLGLNDEQQKILVGSQRALPSSAMLFDLVNREEISEEQFRDYFALAGYTENDIDEALKLRWYIPTISDLVLLAGRDQFEPETISKFSLQQDLPAELVKWGKKIGMSEDWVAKMWGAHWRTPSLNQAFEMVHRGVMDQGELDILYDLADITPYFRERLKQIAYRPYNRIDVRRMHSAGVLSEDDVDRAYQDLGYDENKAARMTEFTVEYNRQREKDLSRSQVEKLYRIGLISAPEFRAYIQTLQYSDNEAWWLQEMVDFDIKEERLKSFLDRIEYEFKRHLIPDTEIESRLIALGLETDRAEQDVARWENERVLEEQLPTRADLKRWVLGGLITETEYRDKMLRLGYSPENVDLYIKEL